MSAAPRHIPVLLNAAIDLLAPAPGEVYVDCTAGLGGHAAPFAQRVGPSGHVILNDVDAGNLEVAARNVREVCADRAPRILTIRGNFASLGSRLRALDPPSPADIVLADLGFSSNQMEDPARGFSFSRDGPLDMRLDPTLPVTAAELVASLSERELAGIIRDFGEDRNAGRIARKLVEARAAAPIETTGHLARVVRSAGGGGGARGGSIDPATRTFQALRIAVNDELGSLQAFLDSLAAGCRAGWLARGCRVGVISFHSLEDRPVKHAFAALAASGAAESLTRKPIEPGPDEVATNARARSAKLRAIRLLG